MNTVLKFNRYVLVKELNEKFKKVGEHFEIANVLDDSFLLRDAKSKLALGVVSFKDFERCFVPVENHKGWTDWTPMVGFDGQSDAYYRTNGKKTQVKFLTNKVRAESCRHRDDEFNLYAGINIAYLRALNKALEKQKTEYEEKLKMIHHDIAENENILKKMINSLGD